MPKHPVRVPGYRFGEWVVLSRERLSCERRTRIYYRCRCICGAERLILGSNLELGKSHSCHRCAHGGVYVRFPQPRALLDRLAWRYKKRNRGVPCDFSDVYAFLQHVLGLEGFDDPSKELSIIDPNATLGPGNLVFVERTVRAARSRSARHIEWGGESMCIAEFHRRFCPGYRRDTTVCRKIREGISLGRIIAEQFQGRGGYQRGSR